MSHLTPVPSDPEELKAWLASLDQDPIAKFLDEPNPAVTLPARPEKPSLLTVKVTLKDTEPPVWRRLGLPGDLTLDALHDVLQEAMGWTDSHLHRFYAGTPYEDPYFVTEYDMAEGDEGTPEAEVHLDQVLMRPGDRFRYEYDFGDGWDHDVLLEEIAPLSGGDRPTCLAGALACPPEDVGGTGGFEALAAWHRAGRTAEALPDGFDSVEHALAWLPVGWDPDAFDVQDVNLRLDAQHVADKVLERVKPGAIESFARLGTRSKQIATWLGQAARTRLTTEDLEDLTRPWRHLLTVIGGGVELSKAGWMPAGHVAELCAALAIDPILAGKGSRESNIKPLAAFRKVATQVGLLHKQHGMLMPTLKGIQLRDDPAGLWAHIASRMPVGRGEISQDAGWFTLVALAGGVSDGDIYDEVHGLLVDAGWQTETGQDLDRWDTPPLLWPTFDCLLGSRRMDMRYPKWLPAVAAEVLFLSSSEE